LWELRESLTHGKGGLMNNEVPEVEGKKPYQTPKLTTISLRPEEAVLGHCKVSGGSGPGGGVAGPCSILLGGCTPLGS
jgi:hypothetical protein